MGAVTWSNDMHIGVKEIDEQHEHLTGLINSLYYAYMEGKEREVLSKIIHEVNDYAHYHFQTEEKYMDKVADVYPFTEGHMEQHMAFFSKVIDFLFQYLDNDTEMTPELLDFLTDWWTKHIMGVDKKLGAAIQEKGLA